MSAIEIILIGVVILLIFGGKKLPELMRGIGRSVKELKMPKTNLRLNNCNKQNFLLVALF